MKVTVFCNRASLCNRDGRRNTAVRLPDRRSNGATYHGCPGARGLQYQGGLARTDLMRFHKLKLVIN